MPRLQRVGWDYPATTTTATRTESPADFGGLDALDAAVGTLVRDLPSSVTPTVPGHGRCATHETEVGQIRARLTEIDRETMVRDPSAPLGWA